MGLGIGLMSSRMAQAASPMARASARCDTYGRTGSRRSEARHNLPATVRQALAWRLEFDSGQWSEKPLKTARIPWIGDVPGGFY